MFHDVRKYNFFICTWELRNTDNFSCSSKFYIFFINNWIVYLNNLITLLCPKKCRTYVCGYQIFLRENLTWEARISEQPSCMISLMCYFVDSRFLLHSNISIFRLGFNHVQCHHSGYCFWGNTWAVWTVCVLSSTGFVAEFFLQKGSFDDLPCWCQA